MTDTAPWRLSASELERFGAATALQSRGAKLAYAELAARAAAVATALGRAGALPGDRVALLSSGRAHDEPVALAGILAAGCVVVPLDVSSPAPRLAGIVETCGCRAIVADVAAAAVASALEAALTRPLPSIVLEDDGHLKGELGEPLTSPRAELEDGPALACILHTSGSTGTPKPIAVTWDGLDAFTRWAVELVGLNPEDRVLRVAELTFDLAWFDHLATFRAGATLVTMTRRDLGSGRALYDALRALSPTVVYGVPSMFMRLAAALPAGEPLAPAPRAVLFAGEVFPPGELRAFAERAPDARLWNLYGPTETNVCTYHEVDRTALDGERETPIGLACPYARCALVSDDGRVLEGPATGELVVMGATVLGGGPHATRDRVERKEDGLYYFRGRIDRMIKIRGYRVEPGEVEAALRLHPAVRQAAVVVVDDPRLGRTLRAFVSLRPGGEADERALRLHAAAQLPSYMVPERVALLEDLPRTTTGKVDYAALLGFT